MRFPKLERRLDDVGLKHGIEPRSPFVPTLDDIIPMFDPRVPFEDDGPGMDYEPEEF